MPSGSPLASSDPTAQPHLRAKLGRPVGGDNGAARQRLLLAALKLFAAQGFANTSIREIASEAKVNIAAVSYYFGDKQNLYRSVFVEPLGDPNEDVSLYDQPHFSLRQSLEGFYAAFLRPLKRGELLQQCMRLHFREMIEPTGALNDKLEHGIKPAQKAIVRTLCRHLGLTQADDEVQRLSFAIVGLSLEYFVGRDLIDAVAPRLVDSPEAIDRTVLRLADFAEAMVQAERVKRAAEAKTLTTAR